MSFLKKFKPKRKLSESASFGSNLSIKSIGGTKSTIIPYSIVEKELPPFLKAVWKNDLNKVQKLIKKNVMVADIDGRTGLHLACAIGNLEMIKQLLEGGGGELRERKDAAGRTSLFKAVESGSYECVKYLMESGSDMEVRDNLGDTLLHVSVKHKYDDLVENLLTKGCEHSLLNKEGFAPIHVAASINYGLGIEKLLSHGVDIDLVTSTGKSALILAAESGNDDIVKVLLSRNADFKIKDIDGKDAYYYADFHQYNDCAQQIRSVDNEVQNKTPPKRPSPLQMPEFIVAQGSELNESLEQKTKSPLKSILRNQSPKNTHSQECIIEIDKTSLHKKEDRISIASENSWSGDISHYSSDTSIPINKSTHIHDVSTPSSMPNPSENIFNPLMSLSNGYSKTKLNKQISDDEESQWTDTEGIVETKLNNESQAKNATGKKVLMETAMDGVDALKNSDSDWDSDTELKMPKVADGHQTDSNIEECFNANYLVLNKPVRYDSNETLENSEFDDDDTELSQTKIPNPNYGIVPASKPPKSPMFKGDHIPIITVEDSGKRRNLAHQAGGDNLSCTSTEPSSRPESFVGSDNLAECEKSNPRIAEEYIKKCSSMESKLRILESEKETLQKELINTGEMKNKIEAENIKVHKDFQKLEVTLSEQKDELNECKSRFTVTEELLKTREKELMETKKLNQDLIASRNEIEMKNIAYNSKINQLNQEIANLQSDIQRSTNSGNMTDNYSVHETFMERSMEHLKNKLKLSDKDAEYFKAQLESERISLQKEKEELNVQITCLQKELGDLKLHSDKIILEQKENIESEEKHIRELTKKFEEEKEENLNKDEEIEQLKKTIKNLNADLESSSKFATMAAREEQKNKALNEQLKVEEEKINNITQEIKILKSQISEGAQSYKSVTHELEAVKNQLEIKEKDCSKLELKYKTFEKQAKDFEKLLESKIQEGKELNIKCSELEEDVMSERNKAKIINEEFHSVITLAMNHSSDPEEVLEQLRNIQKLIDGCDIDRNMKSFKCSPTNDHIDSSIELSKAKSQIRVLQDQLEDVMKDLKESKEEINLSKKFRSLSNILTQVDHLSDLFGIEMSRIGKVERIEKENQHMLNEQTKSLRKAHQQEKQKNHQVQEKEKSLSVQLSNIMKSNQMMKESQETLKQILIKYGKKMDSDDKMEDLVKWNCSFLEESENMDLVMFCQKLLQRILDVIDELKIKLKKVELEKIELEEKEKSRESNQEILVENSKIILTQQLSELSQMMDHQRNNREKLEKIRDENEFQIRNELYELRQSTLMEVSNLNQTLSRVDKDREELIQEVRDLTEQLIKERNLKDSLAEQLVNIMKNPNGSIPQMNGCKEFIFPSTATINTGASQWNIPSSTNEVDRKPYSISMSNLSMLKSNTIEDDELRQKMRNELDRSIAKHLESGRPIRQLNVKDKIRSLNIARYPSPSVAWKAT